MWEHIRILKRLLLVMEIAMHLVTYYTCSKENCKLIAINLSNQRALDADPKAIKQICF